MRRLGSRSRRPNKSKHAESDMTMPQLPFIVTHLFEEIDVPPSEVGRIFDFAGWTETPHFPIPGRTAWHVFARARADESNQVADAKAAKLKGVGVWNPPGVLTSALRGGSQADAPYPPTGEEYPFTATMRHVGLTADGDYTIVHSEPAPLGGMTHRRAVSEFVNASKLLRANVPSIVPFAVIQYTDCSFQGEPMGAVISLSYESAPYRLHSMHFGVENLEADAQAYYARVRNSLGIAGDPADEVCRLEAIRLLAKQIGQCLNGFAAAGLYRYSGGWDNFQYCIDRGSVLLTDLDSSRDIFEVPPDVRAFVVLRDLASALFGLLNRLYYPTVLNRYTVANLLKYDPLSEIICGFFPHAPMKVVHRISRQLWRYYVPHLTLLKRHSAQLTNEWSPERRKGYEMEEDLFFCLAITSMYTLWHDSNLDTLFPCRLTGKQVLQKAEKFLGERYEYLRFLMQ